MNISVLLVIPMCFVTFMNGLSQTPIYVPSEDLIAWWPLDGNAEDLSENSIGGIVVGSTPSNDRFDNPNSAMFFDGQNAKINFGDVELVEGIDGISISLWVSVSSYGSTLTGANIRPIISKWESSPVPNNSFILYQTTNILIFTVQDEFGSDYSVSLDSFDDVEAWHHIVVTLDETGIELWIDGNLEVDDQTVTLDNPIADSNRNLYIGDWYTDIVDTYSLYHGTIDDVGIWSRALSDTEILDLFEANEAVFGCTDATACNYDSTASNDDGSCAYVGDPCDDQDPETTNDLLQDDCSCAGEIVVSVDGCTDPEACNYNPEATTDDGSCTYVESLVISGPVTPESFSTTTYTYPETAGSTYTWTVEGGIITAGQGTASIEVVWSTEGSGNVSVTETNAGGCTGELVTLEVVIFPTNIEEQDASSFSFYPNPANTTITITANAALLNSPYRITDSQGKLVKAGVLQGATTTLDVTSLASGKYTVGVTWDARVLTQTLIIQ